MSGACAEENPAAIPAMVVDVQGDGRWESLHKEFCHQSRDKEANIIFIGDSMVQLMGQVADWDGLLAPFHCFNFGIGGDRTENVLWRTLNGELDNVQPKVVVLWCGTNNHGNSASQIAEGIVKIADQITMKQPESTVIVMSLLPRGRGPNPLRQRNKEANEIVQKLLSSRTKARYLDVTEGFVGADETISTTDMYDFLHLTRHGYQKILDPLVDELTNIVGL